MKSFEGQEKSKTSSYQQKESVKFRKFIAMFAMYRNPSYAGMFTLSNHLAWGIFSVELSFLRSLNHNTDHSTEKFSHF